MNNLIDYLENDDDLRNSDRDEEREELKSKAFVLEREGEEIKDCVPEIDIIESAMNQFRLEYLGSKALERKEKMSEFRQILRKNFQNSGPNGCIGSEPGKAVIH